MKPKESSKKFTLTKETIARLSDNELKNLKGGWAITWYFDCAITTSKQEYSCQTVCGSCPACNTFGCWKTE
jgi:hypothetical protein